MINKWLKGGKEWWKKRILCSYFPVYYLRATIHGLTWDNQYLCALPYGVIVSYKYIQWRYKLAALFKVLQTTNHLTTVHDHDRSLYCSSLLCISSSRSFNHEGLYFFSRWIRGYFSICWFFLNGEICESLSRITSSARSFLCRYRSKYLHKVDYTK